jgi:dehydrogenase/reductase SDR family protein 1
MPKTLQGKVALVTGASRGIGKGVALELADAGARVYLTARSVDRKHPIDPKFGIQPEGTAQQVVDEIRAGGGDAVAIRCDHAEDEQTRNVLRAIESTDGQLDILVNNAMASEAAALALGPVSGGKPFWQVPLEAWDKIMTVGLRSHFATTVMSMPLLTASKGLVVNVSSVGGETYWSSIVYSVEKAGADRMIRDMAEETGPGGVSFLSIWPGFVRTEKNMQPGAWNANLLNRYRTARQLVAQRSGRPLEEVTLQSMQYESQRFCGKAIAAMAADRTINTLSGRVVSTAMMATRYAYKDVDGTVPDAFGTLIPGIWKSLSQ